MSGEMIVPDGFDLEAAKAARSSTPDDERKRCNVCGCLSVSRSSSGYFCEGERCRYDNVRPIGSDDTTVEERALEKIRGRGDVSVWLRSYALDDVTYHRIGVNPKPLGEPVAVLEMGTLTWYAEAAHVPIWVNFERDLPITPDGGGR